MAVLMKLVDQPGEPLKSSVATVVKSDQSGTVVRWELAEEEQRRSVAYKFATASGFMKSLRVLLGLDRASCGWKTALKLRRLGISTPRPLIAIIPTFGHWSAGTYVVTEWLTDAMQVDHFIQSGATAGDNGRQLETSAVESLGQLIGRLHRSSHMHRDLKVANLMLQRDGNRVHASFVDLDGIRWMPLINRQRRMKDLARFSVCFPDDVESRHAVRLRFLRAYLLAYRGDAACWKSEWSLLSAATEKLRHRKHARDAKRFGSSVDANENSLDGTGAIEAELKSTSGRTLDNAA